ncbi:MAG: hypothetical protein ACI9G1_003086 [Pirellulaceae bacterium]
MIAFREGEEPQAYAKSRRYGAERHDTLIEKHKGKPANSAGHSIAVPDSLIETVRRRLDGNLRVRRTLPGNGRIHIDRQVPFLCIYRQPTDHCDTGTEKLIKGEASYLIVPGASSARASIAKLVRAVVKTLSEKFGAFLIVEVWTSLEGGKANDPASPSVLPQFCVNTGGSSSMTPVVDALERRLSKIKILKQNVQVEVAWEGSTHPSGMKPFLTKSEANDLNCSFLGVVVPPVFRRPDSTQEFPQLARELRRSLSLSLRQTYFQFARLKTTHRPKHYHALGRRAVVKAVWDVDRKLAEVSNKFDYLLSLTPVNINSAWKQLQRHRFERAPEFHYRPLTIDPALLKRELYRIPVEGIEDPALHQIFQEKQNELELKLTMLRDRDTPGFLYESLQLFGGVTDELLNLAKDLLNQLPVQASRQRGRKVDAKAFAEMAEIEFEAYRKVSPEFRAKAVVTSEVSGLIVSRGKLLVNSDLRLSPTRVRALLAHEVGTHLVTYYNGRLQPFQQLYSGLAGYEELQEGLAVLAEYLVGGLSASRVRQLAARVVAVHHLIQGASFVDTFRILSKDYEINQRTAYNVTMRVYRGGGLTKDAIYLRGLVGILQYIQDGGKLEPLLVGKMAVEHIPAIKELQYRKVLKPAPLLPHHLKDESALLRLEQLEGKKVSVADLVMENLSGKGSNE